MCTYILKSAYLNPIISYMPELLIYKLIYIHNYTVSGDLTST